MTDKILPDDIEQRIKDVKETAESLGLRRYTVNVEVFQDGDTHIKAEYNLSSKDKLIVHEDGDEIVRSLLDTVGMQVGYDNIEQFQEHDITIDNKIIKDILEER